MTNVQEVIEKQRAVYETLSRPLSSQLASMHKITVRGFADIFGISKSHAEDILSHRKMPSVELAFRIARYYEVSVDELFGWRVDDTGERCPLVVDLGDRTVTRLRRNSILGMLGGNDDLGGN